MLVLDERGSRVLAHDHVQGVGESKVRKYELTYLWITSLQEIITAWLFKIVQNDFIPKSEKCFVYYKT